MYRPASIGRALSATSRQQEGWYCGAMPLLKYIGCIVRRAKWCGVPIPAWCPKLPRNRKEAARG